MDTLERIYELMFCEIDDIEKKDKLDSKDVELIDKFVDIIKDINEISSMSDSGYSQMGGRSYNYGNSYNNYSRRMIPMYSSNMRNNGYSRNDNKEMIMNHLKDLADMATDERDSKAIERLMDQMSKQN